MSHVRFAIFMYNVPLKTHLSNSLLHDTLGGVHAVAELHLVHPQFERIIEIQIRINTAIRAIQNLTASDY